MNIKRETQAEEIRRLAKENGRSLKFVLTTFKMGANIFYNCLKNERFTPEEMKELKGIIINGKKD